MKVFTVPCLQDNYAYVLLDETTGQGAVVDPVDPDRVLAKVKEVGADVKYVLTTHHHYDHAGGNSRFVATIPVPVVGGDERIQAISKIVKNGEILQIGSICVQAIHTPCHTTGHITYYCKQGNEGIIFTGDTLFLSGCGKFFEGTAVQMLDSLDKLAALPPSTLIYCGHEYTASNLRFARSLDPHHACLAERQRWADSVPCTVPATLDVELQTNPFLRVRDPSIVAATGGDADPVTVMGKLREMKNNFRG